MPYLPAVLSYFALFCGGILTRFVVTIMMGEYVIATTSVSEFISAMEKLHMPQQVTIPLSVMFRLFPTIGAEWRSIRRAMRMRGIHLGGAKAGQVVEYQMVPMMTSSVRIGEELSASALTRGLGAPVKRTNICRIGFRAQDCLLLAGCLFVVFVWILENSSHKPRCIVQFHVPDLFSVHKNGPFCLSLIEVRDQAVDQAKYRCLSASGRSGQQNKFSVLYRQIDSGKAVFCPILILCSTVTECHIFQFYHNLTPQSSRTQAQTTKRHPASSR